MKINEQEYRVKKMVPREQFHLLRRLTPLMASMGQAAMGLLDEEKPKSEVMADIMMSIEPAAHQLALMDDVTFDYVLDACLTNIERHDSTANMWHPVYIKQPRGAIRMFADLDAAGELRLCIEVIKVNMTGFFGPLSDVSASSLSAPNPAQE